MPAKNEIVPLDAGPTRQTLAAPAPVVSAPAKPSSKSDLNSDALNAQERRIRLVAAQRRHTAFQLFFALFGVALMVVQMEYLWYANTQDFAGVCAIDPATHCPACLASLPHAVPVPGGRMMLHAVRVLISFSTLIQLYYIHAFYAAECDVLKIKNIVPPKATLLSSPLRNQLVLELLVFAVHPFPGLEAIDPQWPNLVVASSLLMFPRFFLLFRMLQFRDAFNSSNGWFIGALTNVDFTAAFFLKATLRNRPRRWLLASFALLLATTSYSLFVVERFVCAFRADSCCRPITFTDALWTLVVTMLTIGYGDVVPHTSPGRFLAVLAGIFGMAFTAVTIAVMSTYLVLTRSEHKVNAFIKKDENRRLVHDHAARAIQAYVQWRAVQRRLEGERTRGAVSALAKAEQKLYDVLRVYRQVKRFVNSHDVSDPMDKQMTMLEMMEVNVEYIRTKIEDLSDLFHAQATKQHLAANNKRKLQTPTATPTTAVGTPATMGVTGTSKPKSEDASSFTTAEEGSFSGQRVLSETETTTAVVAVAAEPSEAPTPGGKSSPTILPLTGAVPGQPMRYDSDSDSRSVGMDSKMGGGTGSQSPGSSRALSFAGPQKTPSSSEWAIALEQSMQAILLHVTRVSNEVDTLRSRVETQMDQLQDRMVELEKRLGVQDAFREVTRGASVRKNISRAFSGHLADALDGPTAANTTTSASNTNGAVMLGGSVRLNRMSFKQQHRPSIHNFVTSKDLEEFHNSGSID
jgi:hypothetical protein